jgi:hypothetical protein
MSPVDIVTDLLIAGIAGTLGYFGARLGGELWARLILDSSEVKNLQAKLKRRAPLIPAFSQRCARLRLAVGQSEARRRNVERKIDDLHRQLKALESRDDEYIRFVGHPRPGHHHFKAVMINRHVQTAIREGRTHGLLDNSWTRPQNIDIWASSLAEAKSSLNARFPISLGFVVIEMIEPEDAPQQNAEGNAA